MTAWETVALSKGALIVLPLDEVSAPFDNAAQVTDATSVGTVTAGQTPLFPNSGGAVAVAEGSYIDTGVGTDNLVDVSLEIRVNSTYTSSATMMGNRGSGTGWRLGMGWAPVGGGPVGAIHFGEDGGGIWWGVTTDTLWNDGNDHHVIATFDGDAGVAPSTANMHIYVDGVDQPLTARTYSGVAGPLSNTSPWAVAGGVPGFYEGAAVYPVALTAADVADLWYVVQTPPVVTDYAGAVALTAASTLAPPSPTIPVQGAPLTARASLRSPTAPARKPWLAYAQSDGAAQVFEFDATGTDTVLLDKSGNNRHATLVNTPTLDQPGLFAGEKAIKFTRAQTEYVALDTAGLPVGAQPYAIEMVFKPDLVDGSQGLAQIGMVANTSRANGVLLAGSSDNATLYNAWWGNDLSVANRRVAAGKVYHLVAEFDGTTRRLILNGSIMAEAAASGQNALPTNPRLAHWANADYFEGTLYKAAIYTGSTLGQAKARRNYEALLGGPAATITDPRDLPGVIGWYSAQALAATGIADGAAVTSWKDRSGRFNDTLNVFGSAVFRATGGPDGGPCIEFTGGGFNLPDLFRGKTSGYLIAGFRSSAVSVNAGAMSLTGTYVGGEHYTYSNALFYSGFGSTTRHDVIYQHVAVNTWHRLSMYSAPGDWAMFQDGVLLRQEGNTVGWRSNPQIGQVNYQDVGTWNRLSFVLLLDHKPTAAEQTALERYFADNPSGGLAASQPVLTPVSNLAAVAVNAGAYLTWGYAPYAESYEYRVDNGTPVSVGTATNATVAGLGGGAHDIDVRGVSPAGAGPWTRVSVTPRVTYLYDAFDRPNAVPSATGLGTPPQGGPYTVQLGAAGIIDSEAYSTTADTRVTFPAADDVDVQITLDVATSTGNPGIIVRYASATDFYLVQVEGSGVTLRLYHRNGAVWDSIEQVSMKDWQAAGLERLRVRTNGRMIYVFRNDVLVMEFTDPFWTGSKNLAGFRPEGTPVRIAEVLAVPGGPLPTLAAATPTADPLTAATAPTAPTNTTARAYKGRDTKARDMESES